MEYAHDILGRRVMETDPLGHAVHRAYDAENHVVGEWGATYPAAYEYDAWGNLTNTVYSDDTPTISLAYDAMGRMASAVVEGVSTNAYSYSAYGELTNEVQNGISIARNYDAFSRPIGYALNPRNPGNPAYPVEEVSYSYDAFGRFSSVVAGTNVFEFSRLPGTDLVSGYTSGDFSRAVAFEPHRDLIAAVTNSFDSTLISSFDYANDAAGRRVSRIDTFDGATTTNTFGYNVRSEVTSAAMGTNNYGYAYDPIGNREWTTLNGVTNTYAANSLNQYTSLLCASAPLRYFQYDADGNMIADERGWHYAWNGENRMVCASNDEVIVTYAYDHRGRMVQKNISHGDTETQRIEYLWDAWNIVRETLVTPTSTNVTHNVWGLNLDGSLQGAGGVGGLLAVVRDVEVFLPTYDANGNVCEYVTAPSGAIVAHYEYSSFGERLVVAGELASSFTHQFSTKPYCQAIKSNEYIYRKYCPNTGRWMSNASIDKYDYLGLATDCVCPPGSNKGKMQNPDNYNKLDYKCTSPLGDNPAGHPSTSFLPACIVHDICYATCNKSKHDCDDAFRNNLQHLCDRVAAKFGQNSPEAIGCYLWAGVYLAGVQNFGDSFLAGSQSWSNLQKDACKDCCCE